MARSRSNTDWVVAGGKPGEVGWCTRCGTGLTIGLPQPVPVLTAAMKAFVGIHKSCKPGNNFEQPAQTPDEWIAGRDTGRSSATIWSVMTGKPTHYSGFDAPYDPADFGRCFEDWQRLWWRETTLILSSDGYYMSPGDIEAEITERGHPVAWGDPKKILPSGYKSWAHFHEVNHSEEGPNGILRRRIGGNCIGHGAGTWDLIVGEFC